MQKDGPSTTVLRALDALPWSGASPGLACNYDTISAEKFSVMEEGAP